MKFELEKNNREFTENDLIEDVRRVAILLNKNSLTAKEYNQHGRYSHSSCARRFGGWLKALEKAGLEKSREYDLSREEWFKNLENVWSVLGRQPRPKDMEKPLSKYSYAGYKIEFGSWRKALEEFVEYINNEPSNNLTDTQIILSDNKHKTPRNVNHRLRFLVMRKNNFKCCICGASPATNPNTILVIDHIIPWAKGGETVIENLQTLCSSCNGGKSDLLV